MVLIGIGQGLVFAPVTAFGLTDVHADDAGAASGLINTFHQVGSTLGLGVLITLAARSGTEGSAAAATDAARSHAALEGSSGILALALIVAIALLAPAVLANRRAPTPRSARPRRTRPRRKRRTRPTPQQGVTRRPHTPNPCDLPQIHHPSRRHSKENQTACEQH